MEAAPGFRTARVGQDLRLVFRKDGPTTLIAHVDHHDPDYRRAERRRIVPRERTGAMQFVEVVERAEERLFHAGRVADAPEPLPAVRPFASLPDEPAKALLDVPTGGRIEDHVAARAASGASVFSHPDAQRRFRQVDGIDELPAALEAPWAQSAVFLHPAQAVSAVRAWTGPARVSGLAGTGKTIVALHRAVRLAADPDARVLLTTFSEPLARNLVDKVAVLTVARG